jgi:putative hydrolase of the HAD superfamily
VFGGYNSAIMTEFKVVLFDLGSTLIYSKDPWPPIYTQADQALVDVLQQAGIPLQIKTFSSEFETFLDTYYAGRSGPQEKTTFSVLQELLEQKGFNSTPAAVVRAALDAMYSVTQKNWFIEEDAIPTLEKLREQGYRLGIVSNTSDDPNVQTLVDRWGLHPYFETIITSAGCGIRKPDRRIFQLALQHFKTPAEQMVMTGDTLEADILGANQIGMYSVWITRRVEIQEEGELAIQPQAAVARLDELPSLLAEIQSDSTQGGQN